MCIVFSFSCLGDMQYLRIWHDNSGKGKYASWYLNYVIFVDLQTQSKYHFIVDQWLAVEKNDGQVSEPLLEHPLKFYKFVRARTRKNLNRIV